MKPDIIVTRPANHGIRKHELAQRFIQFAQRNQFRAKPQHLCRQFVFVPVNPRDFAVLTKAVVVALLRAPDFVSTQDHRRSA